MVGSPAPWVRVGWAGGQGLALAIPDVTAPTVVSFSPADNATNVSRSTDLVATMSEVVVLGASGLISLKKTSDNSVIQTWDVATQAGLGAGQVSVVGGTDLTMRLTASLATSTEYYVIWAAGVVKDTSGNNVAALSVTTTWSFTTTVGDIIAPTVVSFSPADNATGVAITTNLVATMSETVVLGASGVITLKKTSDNSTIDSWNVATASGSTAGKVEVVGGTALTMHLTTSLANSIEYYVIWDAGVVVDTSANPVAVQASTTLWSFTTAAVVDVTPPTVTSFSPANGSTGALITTDLVATFSETVVLGASGIITLKLVSDNSTITSWNVATQAGSGAGQVNVVGGNQLTMRLAASLTNLIDYRVTWQTGVVQDTSGNPVALIAAGTWEFQTASSYTPSLNFSDARNSQYVGTL